MKYLIVGLGNIGQEYDNTRHNIGFKILDAFAKASNVVFEENRYGAIAECKVKNKTLILLKPNTYMNLSGNAVRYWLQQEKIEQENLLVICDDLALPFASLRMKPKGSNAGHNGLGNIQSLIGENYARLRFGLGNNFPKGKQVDFVLGRWSEEEEQQLVPRIEMACEMIKSFALCGIQLTMTQFNNK